MYIYVCTHAQSVIAVQRLVGSSTQTSFCNKLSGKFLTFVELCIRITNVYMACVADMYFTSTIVLNEV